MSNIIAYLDNYEPVTMHFDQAMHEPDWEEFLNENFQDIKSHHYWIFDMTH